jgi:Lon protease-like protein
MQVYVFPIGRIVFYPSVSKPLNIFEPRYIQMVHDAVRTGTPIALAHVDEPDREHAYCVGSPLAFVRPVAGYGRPLVLQTRDDGTLLVFMQGQGKVELGPVLATETPYIVCEAQPISENNLMKEQVVQDFTFLNKVLLRWMETHIPEPGNRQHFLKNIRSAEEVIGCYASYLVADRDMQQLLLESNDINEKITLVRGLIASGEIV